MRNEKLNKLSAVTQSEATGKLQQKKPNMKQTKKGPIAPGSFLDNLYTNYTVSQLQAMSDAPAEPAILLAWDLSEDAYFNDVRKAIQLVIDD